MAMVFRFATGKLCQEAADKNVHNCTGVEFLSTGGKEV
jgi:hypothetical protein